MKRVVITGIGAVTPVGGSFISSWEAVVSGRSGLRPISRFDASGLPWSMAGEVQGFDPSGFLAAKEIQRLDPFIQFAAAAAAMAAEDAGLKEKDAACGGVIIGSGRGGIGTMEKAFSRFLGRPEGRRPHMSAYLMPATTISMAASIIARKWGVRGYCLGISNACASGANAIGEAYRLLKSGYGGPILAGGAEAPVCRFCVEGYGASGVLSKGKNPAACRPFDETRDGFVLAEGACVLVLENLDAAIQRGAGIYAEVIGYGNTSDAFHQTKPDPSGEAEAISAALRDAGISPDDVDYINAHAPSTILGDRSEAEAIHLVFGERAAELPVSATKSMTGHMLAASGAFEAAVTVMSISRGVLTPTAHLRHASPDCSLSHIADSRPADIGIGISNSFGFGGVNAVLAFRKFRD